MSTHICSRRAMLALALVAPIVSVAAPQPARAQGRADPTRATIVAELLEPGPSSPACGILHSIVVMRYRVLAVEAGSVTEPELFVAVSCPEMHRVAFRAGERHRVVLTRRRPWTSGSLVWHQGRPQPSPLVFATALSPAPAP